MDETTQVEEIPQWKHAMNEYRDFLDHVETFCEELSLTDEIKRISIYGKTATVLLDPAHPLLRGGKIEENEYAPGRWGIYKKYDSGIQLHGTALLEELPEELQRRITEAKKLLGEK